MRSLSIIAAVALSLVSLPARAGDLAPLDKVLGAWVSPDGASRVTYESRFDGHWIDTKMWFKQGEEWKPVGQGGVYRHTSDGRIISVMRTVDMIGIELFETIMSPSADGFELSNTAYLPDGSMILTEEEWSFPEEDRWTYTVYKIEGDEQEKWFTDGWVRE